MLIYKSHNYKIYKANTMRCSCFLIEHGKDLVLWDTSMKYELGSIYHEIEKTTVKKLSAVFISHAHTDHAANAQTLSKKFSCPVYVHENGIELLRNGRCPVPKGTNVMWRTIQKLSEELAFVYDFAKIASCRNIDILNRNIVLNYLGENAELLEVKGHTNDSYALALDGRICLSGDVFVNSFCEFYPPFADYPEELISSWKKLLALNCTSYYPGHGKAVNRETLSKNIKRAERRKKQR